jgi:phosphate transport system permease protein
MPSAAETPASPPVERQGGESLAGLSSRASGQRRGDRIFSGLAKSAGVLILVTLAGVATFLVIEAMPAITADADRLPEGKSFIAYVAPLAFGSVLAALIAVVIAVPIAIAVALFITHVAPPRMAAGMSYVIDLLAAIPSIIYGLWGIVVLGPASVGAQTWLETQMGWLPLFEGPATSTGRTMLIVGLVLALMILPIVTAVSRSVFTQTPRRLQEGALALGATRWEMIRMTVLPFGKSAVISASMLGLGRALGETMAVAIILSVSGGVTFNLISSANPSTIAANIALDFPESSGVDINTLIASGLVLFAVTLIINMAARAIINREVRI